MVFVAVERYNIRSVPAFYGLLPFLFDMTL